MIRFRSADDTLGASKVYPRLEGSNLMLGSGLNESQFMQVAYDAYFSGKLQDYAYPEEKVKESLEHLPKVAQ